MIEPETVVSYTKLQLEFMIRRRHYEKLQDKSALLISRLENVEALLNPIIIDQLQGCVVTIRSKFESAQDAADEITDYHPCDECRFDKRDINALNNEIAKISACMKKIGNPIKSLTGAKDPNITTIKDGMDETIEAGEEVARLARKRLKTREYEEITITSPRGL